MKGYTYSDLIDSKVKKKIENLTVLIVALSS